MPASAKIIADSVSPDGVRLTTFEVVLARAALAELNTHRMLSRNSASSRAIPFEKMIKRVQEDPYIPAWTLNQKGMQGALLDPDAPEFKAATREWLYLRDRAIESVQLIGQLGIHKQDVNRALEPWMWHTVIITATECDNFWHLRDHPAAYMPMQEAARAMRAAYLKSVPVPLEYGQWHLPFLQDDERWAIDWKDASPQIKISVGRCARVSYLTHDGKRDLAEDIALHDRLLSSGHMSPFEHVARPAQIPEDARYVILNENRGELWSGNFRGWVQYRKTIPNEHDILGAR